MEEEKIEEVTIDDLKKQLADLQKENGKLKNAITNASGDASKFKKLYNEKLSEQERIDQEQKEKSDKLLQELESLKRDKAVSEYNASFLTIGYPEELAKASAEAIADGNITAVFDRMKEFISHHDKALVAENLKNTPSPHISNTDGKVTKEEFEKMGYSEMAKFQRENPELFKEYTR